MATSVSGLSSSYVSAVLRAVSWLRSYTTIQVYGLVGYIQSLKFWWLGEVIMHVDLLTDLILGNIFSYLSLQDLRTSSLVSKKWYRYSVVFLLFSRSNKPIPSLLVDLSYVFVSFKFLGY